MSISTPLQGRLLLAVSLAVPSLLAAGAAQAQSIPSSSRLTSGGSLSAAPTPVTKIDESRLNRFGCPACRSGLDARFNQRQEVINPVVNQPAVLPAQAVRR
jgi:hypothetical protein